MPIISGQSPEVQRIIEALGNSYAHIKSVTIKLDVDCIPTVVIERFIDNDEQIDAIADLIEQSYLVFHTGKDEPKPIRERTGPTANLEHYRPQEIPTRYPLELTPDLHICLWFPEGNAKMSIGYWHSFGDDGYDFKFVGDRPLSPRINWDHFRELLEQGQAIADQRWRNRND